jgi:DNA-directed RNA polymerase subunit F
MIIKRTPLSMAESLEYLKEDKETTAFVKKFTKLNEKKAKELREELVGLDLIKLNESGIAKIIDALPETKEELNKAVLDINLDEDETNKVLETIKKYI